MPPQVLTRLDKAKVQLYHFIAIIVAGLGFFTDAYDLFATISITKLLGRLYYQPYEDSGGWHPGQLPTAVYGALTGTAYVGALCGQLFFGYLGDRLGRRRVYAFTLILMMVGSLCCGLSYGKTTTGVIVTLCFFRFWIGFGLGGDYPLSAVIMSEFCNERTRGAFVAAVFAMQGFGILFAAAVTLILAAIFKAVYPAPSFETDHAASTPEQADYLWRTVVMFGAVPAALTFYFRMKMKETPRFTYIVKGNPGQAIKDMKDVLNFDFDEEGGLDLAEPVKKKEFGLFSKQFAMIHGRELLGTTVCWFLVDVVFYSLSMYQKDLFQKVGWVKPREELSALEETFRYSRAQALLALVATIPGYWFTVFTVDIVGRKPIQLMGFFMMTIFMVILSTMYNSLSHFAFIALYALTFFFTNWGPNSTTFIIPAELFPARLRSKCNGIAAAGGKAGAIVGAFGIMSKDLSGNASINHHFQLMLGLIAICNFFGFFFTFLLPETKGKGLEFLSKENCPANGMVELNGGGSLRRGGVSLRRGSARDGSIRDYAFEGDDGLEELAHSAVGRSTPSMWRTMS